MRSATEYVSDFILTASLSVIEAAILENRFKQAQTEAYEVGRKDGYEAGQHIMRGKASDAVAKFLGDGLHGKLYRKSVCKQILRLPIQPLPIPKESEKS